MNRCSIVLHVSIAITSVAPTMAAAVNDVLKTWNDGIAVRSAFADQAVVVTGW
jgi:hypothetical protein